jgi:hypothetical protein
MRPLRIVDVLQETRAPAGEAKVVAEQLTTLGVVPVQVPVRVPVESSMVSPLPATWIVHGAGIRPCTAPKNALIAAGFAAPVE